MPHLIFCNPSAQAKPAGRRAISNFHYTSHSVHALFTHFVGCGHSADTLIDSIVGVLWLNLRSNGIPVVHSTDRDCLLVMLLLLSRKTLQRQNIRMFIMLLLLSRKTFQRQNIRMVFMLLLLSRKTLQHQTLVMLLLLSRKTFQRQNIRMAIMLLLLSRKTFERQNMCSSKHS